MLSEPEPILGVTRVFLHGARSWILADPPRCRCQAISVKQDTVLLVFSSVRCVALPVAWNHHAPGRTPCRRTKIRRNPVPCFPAIALEDEFGFSFEACQWFQIGFKELLGPVAVLGNTNDEQCLHHRWRANDDEQAPTQA